MTLDDARTVLSRGGVAARSLEGVLRADRYADATLMRCVAPSADLRHAPADAALLDSQLLYGELFEVLEEADGFAFGQTRRDGYVGYVRAEGLGATGPLPTHRVKAPRTYAFAEPDLRSQALGLYSMNALLEAGERDGRFISTDAGFVFEGHLAPIGQFETDPAEVAGWFLGAPTSGAVARAWAWTARGWCSRPCSPAASPARGTPISRRSWGARSKRGSCAGAT